MISLLRKLVTVIACLCLVSSVTHCRPFNRKPGLEVNQASDGAVVSNDSRSTGVPEHKRGVDHDGQT